MTTTKPEPGVTRPHPAAGRGAVLTAVLTAVLAASTTAGAPTAAAQIYRTVDEDGNVVFTDVPPRPDEAAETVELGSGSTFTPPPAAVPAETPLRWSDVDGAVDEPAADAAAVYQSVEIASPGNDEAVRENSGNIVVSARVVPELRPGHRVQLELDGQIVQTSEAPSFQLQYVDRGTHQVRVHVLDESGTILRSSDPSTFHLLRYSKLTAPNRPRVNGGS